MNFYSCRLMIRTPWRTSTPSWPTPRPQQVCSTAFWVMSPPQWHVIPRRFRSGPCSNSEVVLLALGFYSCNTEVMPGVYNWTSGLQVLPQYSNGCLFLSPHLFCSLADVNSVECACFPSRCLHRWGSYGWVTPISPTKASTRSSLTCVKIC